MKTVLNYWFKPRKALKVGKVERTFSLWRWLAGFVGHR